MREFVRDRERERERERDLLNAQYYAQIVTYTCALYHIWVQLQNV